MQMNFSLYTLKEVRKKKDNHIESKYLEREGEAVL